MTLQASVLVTREQTKTLDRYRPQKCKLDRVSPSQHYIWLHALLQSTSSESTLSSSPLTAIRMMAYPTTRCSGVPGARYPQTGARHGSLYSRFVSGGRHLASHHGNLSRQSACDLMHGIALPPCTTMPQYHVAVHARGSWTQSPCTEPEEDTH